MQAEIQFHPVSINDANNNFETNHRHKLEEFLRNECILDPQGIERVVNEMRNIYIRTCHAVSCQLTVPATPDPKYQDNHAQIMQYLQQHGPGVCESFLKSLTEVRGHLLMETARQLAYLDEKSHKRLSN